MTDQEIRAKLEAFADEVGECKSTEEAKELRKRLHEFVNKYRCYHLRDEVFAFTGLGETLEEMADGEFFCPPDYPGPKW